METLRVLIIEDSLDDSELIILSLKRAGRSVEWHRVENEAELRKALAENNWNVVISDYRLPSFSGLDAFAIFQDLGEDIPFIMISGTIGEDVAVDAMRCGVSDYLMKGNLARLAPAIERELKEAAIRREKRLAELALKESEERYRIVAETASDAIITIDGKSQILYVNSAAERIFGYDRSEMVGNSLTMIVPESMRKRHSAGIKKYLETKTRTINWSGFEIQALRKDGIEIIVNISFGEFVTASQHLFTAIVRDVTEQKAAEIALKRSEHDFRALVEATTHFVWKLDEQGNLTEFPHWWVVLTGQSFEESINYGWMDRVHPQDRDEVQRRFNFGIQNREHINIELRIRNANEEYRYYEARGVPVLSPSGDSAQWICALVDVTERKLSAIELRESEEKFRALVKATTQFVFTAAEDGTSEELFQWFSENFGVEVSSVEEILKLIHPDERRRVVDLVLTAKSEKKLFDQVCRFVKSDGSLLYLAVRVVPVNTANGTFRHWIGTFTDISERMTAQEALRQSETQLRTIVDSVPECVKLLDLDGRLLKVNQPGLTILECDSFEEIRGGDVADFVSEEYRDVFRHSVACAARGDSIEIQFEMHSLRGTRRWMNMNAIPIRGNENEVVAILSVTRDETERQKTDQSIRRSEERFRDLFENANDLIYTHDLNGNYTSLNRAGELITGYDRAEIEGLNLIDVVAPEYVEKAKEMLKKKLFDHSATAYEIEIFTKDERRVVLDLSTRLIYEDGKAVGVQGIARDITERKQAEAELRTRELQLRVITDTVPVLIAYVGADLRLRFANRAFLERVGKDLGDVVGKKMNEIVGDEACMKVREEFSRVLSGENFEIERHLHIPARRAKTIEPQPFVKVNYVPEFNDAGEVTAFFVFTTDLTVYKQAEEVIKTNEKQLRIVTDTVPVLIAYVDKTQRFRFVNKSYIDWIGRTEPEIIGRTISEVQGKESFRSLANEAERALHGEEFTVDRSATIPTPGASESDRKKFRVNYVPDRSVDGTVNGYFIFCIDLTETIKADIALKKSEEQLRLITNTVPVLIAYYDRNQICQFANDSYISWLNRTKENTVGFHARAILGDAIYQKVRTEFERPLAGEELDFERLAFFKDKTRPEKESIFLRLNYVPDIEENGDVIGFYFFAIDLSETKKAEEALRKSEEQLIQSQKLESVGRLAGGIAHDFNNMLTAINGYSELTLRRMHPGDPLRHNIEEIRKAGERSAELTNQLLAFSRKQIMQPRILELNQAVADLVPMLERLIGEDVHLRTSFASDAGMVNADPGQLSQVLLNLVVNARDSMPDGGSIIIETGIKSLAADTILSGVEVRQGQYATMAISDTGIGMDKQTIRHIFEPFFTTKEVGKGTGLGLSTVHGIVLQSGGYVSVESTPGEGTRFEIMLPAAGNAVFHTSKVTNENGDSTIGHETILLVEDEETVRDLGREVLESCGYTVLTANDGEQAIKLLAKKGSRISLMMTDVVMPNMGGRELAEHTALKYPKIKVLFSSGYDDRAIVQKGVLNEGTNFIQKPFSFDELALKVRELLDKN